MKLGRLKIRAGEASWTYTLLVILMLLPLVLHDPYFLHILIIGGIYAILAIGMNIITGYAGQINLGMAGFYAVGAYTSAILATKYNLTFWEALPFAAIFSAVAGFFVGVPALKVRGGVYLVLITTSFAGIVKTILNQWTSMTKGPMGIVGIPAPKLGSLVLYDRIHWFYLVYVVVAVLAFFTIRLVNSRVGRSLVALRESEVSAMSLGINPAYYKVLAMVLSAFLAGVAGSLYASYMTTVSPDVFDFNLSVLALMMIVVGGVGSIPGSIIGGVVLAIVPEVLRAFDNYQTIIYAVLLVLAVIFLPSGLTGLGTNASQFLAKRFSPSKEGKA